MRLVRTILALAIAVSLAMLPIGASARGVAMPADDMRMSMQLGGAADMSMDDCCPGDTKGTTSNTDGYKCGMGFCCIGGALALGDVRAVTFAFAMTVTKIAIPEDQVVSFHGGSPPFRPPRI